MFFIVVYSHIIRNMFLAPICILEFVMDVRGFDFFPYDNYRLGYILPGVK